MPSITFIEQPLFRVDFAQFSQGINEQQPQPSCLQRVERVAFSAIELVKSVFIAVTQSAYLTLSCAGTSFKYTVLGYYNGYWIRRGIVRPSDIYLVAFKLIFWMAQTAWCFTATTARLLYQRLGDDSSSRALLLSRFSKEGQIHVAHIQTNELAIDVSEVPADVTVDDLLGLFDQINFTDRRRPGYMAPSSRAEGRDIVYSVDELREALVTFIDYVNRRVAFLGTPPQSDMPRLLAFYQQMEDAVRFCINQVNKDLREFQAAEGHDPTAYNEESTRKYKNLLENSARVALNLAKAGKHCGARFMGEAMELYDTCNGEGAIAKGSLQGTLIEILALKRKEIARQQIQEYFGADTHGYNNYMSNLGHILAIPGTEHVIEHLSRNFDRNLFLTRFFEKYTVDVIQAAIQDKVKSSNLFREKIYCWLRGQIGDWEPEGEPGAIPDVDALVAQATPILEAEQIDTDDPFYMSFLRLQAMIAYLKQQPGQLLTPDVINADSFIDELFALQAAKTWFEGAFPKASRVDLVRLKNHMKSLFSDENLGNALLVKIKGVFAENIEQPNAEDFQRSLFDEFFPKLLMLSKVSKICDITSLPQDVAIRIVRGEKSLEEAILEHRDQNRKIEFLDRLKLSEVDEDFWDKNARDESRTSRIQESGLPPGMLEWLLVSQEILLPQEDIITSIMRDEQ